MLLNLVNTKSVSQCILAYYNEIRKLENRSILSDTSYRSTEPKLLNRSTFSNTCIFRFGNCASSTADGPPLRYYKHRLAPFLYPYRYFKRMKKHNQEAYIKALERRLSATEVEKSAPQTQSCSLRNGHSNCRRTTSDQDPKKVWPHRRSEPNRRPTDSSLSPGGYGAVVCIVRFDAIRLVCGYPATAKSEFSG